MKPPEGVQLSLGAIGQTHAGRTIEVKVEAVASPGALVVLRASEALSDDEYAELTDALERVRDKIDVKFLVLYGDLEVVRVE